MKIQCYKFKRKANWLTLTDWGDPSDGNRLRIFIAFFLTYFRKCGSLNGEGICSM